MEEALFEVPAEPGSTDWMYTEADKVVEQLHKHPGWPADRKKDRELICMLMEQYPTIDLSDEITKWRAWMLSYESKRKVNHRARFANWCSLAANRARGRSVSRHAAGAGAPRPTARAGGRPGDFAGVESGLGSW